jgi:hypothetical protein
MVTDITATLVTIVRTITIVTWATIVILYMRRIHKIGSVCKYCRCNAAVTMVRMRAEFVGPFGRRGRNLQTIEPH